MNFIKQIQSDFYRSKGKNETFLEWFLIRKLDTKGKILFALFYDRYGSIYGRISC